MKLPPASLELGPPPPAPPSRAGPNSAVMVMAQKWAKSDGFHGISYHRKTIGKWWFNGISWDFMGFHMI